MKSIRGELEDKEEDMKAAISGQEDKEGTKKARIELGGFF